MQPSDSNRHCTSLAQAEEVHITIEEHQQGACVPGGNAPPSPLFCSSSDTRLSINPAHQHPIFVPAGRYR